MWVSDIDSRINIANYHNDVRTDIIRPRSLHNFIDKHLVGTALAAVRYRRKPIQSYSNCGLLMIGIYLRDLP